MIAISTRIGALFGALAVAACWVVPGGARAAEALDQQSTCWDNSYSEIGWWGASAQTFTAGATGFLDRVELNVNNAGDSGGYAPDGPLNLRIEPLGADGLPTGDVLASATIPASAAGTADLAWVSATFAHPAEVSAGTRYAMVATTDPTTTHAWIWNGFSSYDCYGGGEWFVLNSFGTWVPYAVGDLSDQMFRTYVGDAPPPAASVEFLAPLTPSTAEASVINTAKNGRVVPVKVRLAQDGSAITDANAPGPVRLAVSDLGPCGSGASTDPVDAYGAGSSSAGDAFHYDSTAQAWVYNVDTKAMSLRSGDCYRLEVSVAGLQAAGYALLEPVR